MLDKTINLIDYTKTYTNNYLERQTVLDNTDGFNKMKGHFMNNKYLADIQLYTTVYHKQATQQIHKLYTRRRQHTYSTAKLIGAITTVVNAITRQVFWNTPMILMTLELKWRTRHCHTCSRSSHIHPLQHVPQFIT